MKIENTKRKAQYYNSILNIKLKIYKNINEYYNK